MRGRDGAPRWSHEKAYSLLRRRFRVVRRPPMFAVFRRDSWSSWPNGDHSDRCIGSVQTSVRTRVKSSVFLRTDVCRGDEGILPTRDAEEARVSKTGSIKKTGSTWGFVLDVGRSNGRRQQVRKRGFRTKKDMILRRIEAMSPRT
jgi:hypothetical protein